MKKDNKKIKVAFPHMGTIYIAWAAALRKVGVEPFIPPYTSKKTLSLGTKHSPEAICLPYKLILGNFIEAVEGGADYVAMISSPGICRLGEYGACIKNALSDMGYKANYIELTLYDGIKGMYNFLKEISGKNDPVLFLRAIILAMRKVFILDDLETKLSFYRAREINYGEAEKHFIKALKIVDEAMNTRQLNKAKKMAFAEMDKTKFDPKREVLNVDITALLDYPTGRYSNTSDIEKGQNFLDPESEKEGLFGYQQAFSKEMIKELYGTLAHYREMAEKNTKEQVTKGFVCREDAAELVEIAVELAKKRGLE